MGFAKGWIIGVLIIGFVSIGLGGGEVMAYTVAEFGDGGFLNVEYQVHARAAKADIGAPGTGDSSTTNYYLRRDRLSFLGMFNETYGYAIQFEYPGGTKIGPTGVSPDASDYELSVLDYYLTADYSSGFKIRAGKVKHILTREVMEGCFDPLSIDRSYFILGPFGNSGEKTTRDEGVILWGNLFEDKLQYRASALLGNNYGEQKPDSAGYRYTGRLHLSLFDPENGLGYKGSYLGKKKVLTLGAGYEMESAAVYSVGATGAEDYTAYSYDLFFEYPTDAGTFTASAAYLNQDFNGAGVNGIPGAAGIHGEKNGGYWKAAYMIGKFQVYGRMEKWSFANLDGVSGQIVNWTAEGINYYIKGQNLRLTLEVENIAFDKPTATGDFTTTLLQFQGRF